MSPGAPLSATVNIESLNAFRDARGSLFEPLDQRGLSLQKNVHVVVSEPGAVRGNHLHRHSTEMTTVVGPCRVRFSEAGIRRDVEVPANEVWRFTIPPGIAHAYQNTGNVPMTMVSFNSHAHDPANPDTVPEVIL